MNEREVFYWYMKSSYSLTEINGKVIQNHCCANNMHTQVIDITKYVISDFFKPLIVNKAQVFQEQLAHLLSQISKDINEFLYAVGLKMFMKSMIPLFHLTCLDFICTSE